MSVLKSNFTVRISNHIQKRIRERVKAIRQERGEHATSVNNETEKAIILGLRELEKKDD